MEPEKYYEFYNGLYDVYFANKKGLSVEEITDIFSEFGTVVMVRKAGDDYGYRFVKYRHEEEVLRCIEGLRNHQTIRLKLKDPNYKNNKKQTNNNKLASGSYGQKNWGYNGQKSEIHDNNDRRSCEASASENGTKSIEKEKHHGNSSPTADSKRSAGDHKNDAQGATDKADDVDTKVKNPQDVRGTRFETAGDHENDAQGVTDKADDVDTKVKKPQDVRDTSFETSKIAARLRHPQVAAETFISVCAKTPSTDNAESSTKPLNTSVDIEKSLKSEALRNKPVNAVKSLDFAAPSVETVVATEEIPKLVVRSPVCVSPENSGGAKVSQAVAAAMPATVIAEEVVVANIHSDFGVHYILHLIQKHDPLCVSEMRVIASLGLRYCTVYLQSLHQAQAIEKDFDNLSLSGKNLIVLRPQTLAELTATV